MINELYRRLATSMLRDLGWTRGLFSFLLSLAGLLIFFLESAGLSVAGYEFVVSAVCLFLSAWLTTRQWILSAVVTPLLVCGAFGFAMLLQIAYAMS